MDNKAPRLILARDLMAADLPERRMLLDPLLTTKTLVLLYGPRGLAKTFVAMGIAWAVASGGSFLGWRASKPAHVAPHRGGRRLRRLPDTSATIEEATAYHRRRIAGYGR